MSDERRPRTTAEFHAALQRSAGGVFFLARWLYERGHAVELTPPRYTPTAAQWAGYVDGGDIFVLSPGPRQRVEVKHWTKKPFTGRADFPYAEVLVSRREAADRHPDVATYFIISVDYAAMALILPATRQYWFVRNQRADNSGNVEECYAVSVDHVRFVSLSS